MALSPVGRDEVFSFYAGLNLKRSTNRLASTAGVGLKRHHATANSSSPSRIMNDETRTSGHLLLDKTTDNITDSAPPLHISPGG